MKNTDIAASSGRAGAGLRGLSALSALLLAGSAAAGGTVLWPSALAELKAQPDSRIAPLPDGSMGVETGVGYSWPGVRLDFRAGTFDLSPYGEIVITLSNTTDRACAVNLSVKGARQGAGPGGQVALPPRGCADLVAQIGAMPWALDAPLALEGMNGRPVAKGGAAAAAGGAFDVSKAGSFHIFISQDAVPRGFSVRRIAVGGVAAPQKVLPAASFLPFVDRYGQFRHDDWPGKVHGDGDLAAARAAEDAWLKEHAGGPIPDADEYGGWAGGPRLKATGFFRTEKVKGKWWLVDPEGRLFFSHGVDCVRVTGETGVSGREGYYEWLPGRADPDFGACWSVCKRPGAHGFYKDPSRVPYDAFSFARANARRKYGPGWMRDYPPLVARRLRAWGLNTIANWSDERIYSGAKVPYTLCLGTWAAPRLKDSTGWWGALPDPFSPDFERTFREEARRAGRAMRDDPLCLGVFVDNELSWNGEPRMAEVAERYFSTVAGVLREELPNHLYLGCRIAWGTDVVYRAAARHCDVVSVNVYGRAPVRDLPEGSADKPMINGEFHFGALDRGMFHTGLVATRDQGARAAAYRRYVEACLDHPRLVGTHWFQWQDQPLTGRSDGENYQIGFVTVADAPYPELVAAARAVAAEMYPRRYGKD